MAKAKSGDINDSISNSHTPNQAARYSAATQPSQKLLHGRQLYQQDLTKQAKKADDDRYKHLAKLESDFQAKNKRQRKTLDAALRAEENVFKHKQLAEEKKAKKEAASELNKMLITGGDTFGTRLKAAGKQFGQNLLGAAKNAAANLFGGGGKLVSGIDGYMGLYGKYMGTIDARLQGSSKNFNSIMELIRHNLSFSPLVKQTAVLENLSALVEQGINYNVEQRAFLGTVSDKIAATFDAANGTLLQLIRIQQSDTTAARLGIEATLTKFLNSTFEDSSYLSDTYDKVAASLLGASSQLGRDEAVAFEYVVQKWLGSLGSVGVSENTLLQIASGINALVTGDITTLSSNNSLMNLIAMAANNAGLPLGTALTKGINSSDANRLLREVVEYTQELANTSNQVVKSQYAELFGLSISDFTAVLNLKSEELGDIANNMYSYSQALQETNNQLKLVDARTHLSEKSENLFENILVGSATAIASNPASYMIWKAASLIKDVTGGINIPIPIPTTDVYELELMGTIKAGMAGLSLLGNLVGGLSSIMNGGGMNLAYWGGAETTSRGSGFQGIDAGAGTSTSQSSYVGSEDSSALKESAMKDSSSEMENNQSGEDPADNMEAILKILQSWDLNGYGVKSIAVTPIAPADLDKFNVLSDTLNSEDHPVALVGAHTSIKANNSIEVIEEADPGSAILKLLEEVVLGTKSLNVVVQNTGIGSTSTANTIGGGV